MRIAFGAALILTLLGCESQSESRREAERVVLAIRSLREADNSTKLPRLSALRQIECKLPDVCELKDECSRAYKLFLEGLDAVRAVKKDLEADAAAPDSATRLLDEAEQKVKQGRDGATKCAELEGRVATKYKIP